jgi:hypothetical protein
MEKYEGYYELVLSLAKVYYECVMEGNTNTNGWISFDR